MVQIQDIPQGLFPVAFHRFLLLPMQMCVSRSVGAWPAYWISCHSCSRGFEGSYRSTVVPPVGLAGLVIALRRLRECPVILVCDQLLDRPGEQRGVSARRGSVVSRIAMNGAQRMENLRTYSPNPGGQAAICPARRISRTRSKSYPWSRSRKSTSRARCARKRR